MEILLNVFWYCGTYSCIKNLILVLLNLFLYFGYGSTRRYYRTFYLYKSTYRYYRIDTEVPVGTLRSLPYLFFTFILYSEAYHITVGFPRPIIRNE